MNSKRRFLVKEDEKMDALLPFLSLLLIIIPILIGNISFSELNSIELSTPLEKKIISIKNSQNPNTLIMARLIVEPKVMLLEMIDEKSTKVIERVKKSASSEGAKDVFSQMQKFKGLYPKFEIILVNIHKDVTYEKVVTILDQIKKPISTNTNFNLGSRELNSNNKDTFSFNFVMLPKLMEYQIEKETLNNG